MAELTPAEASLWHAWKTASEQVRGRVAADIATETGLSDPDFAILTRLVELGDGALRQNALAEALKFHRSRLSHQLSRMEDRGLVTRSQKGGGVEVRVTEAGREAVRAARPVHASSVRRHLLEPLADLDQDALLSCLGRLAATPVTVSGPLIGSDAPDRAKPEL